MDTDSGYYKLPMKKILIWIVVHISYTFLGSLLYIYLEECLGIAVEETSKYKPFADFLANSSLVTDDERLRILNVTKAYFVKYKKRTCAIEHESIIKWWHFTTVTCYTIGKYRRAEMNTLEEFDIINAEHLSRLFLTLY